MIVKASELRRNLFTYLDRCVSDGEVLEVPRHGSTVRIAVAARRLPVAELPSRPGAVVDPESLDTFSPSEWTP